MNEKKVVTVIVEGPSDENAIGGILKEFFSSEEVQFPVDIPLILGNLITIIFDYQILRKPLKTLSL